MKTNEMLMLAQNLHKNHLYSTFAPLAIKQNATIPDTEVEVLNATIHITKTIQKTDIVLHLEIDLVTIKVLLLHYTLDHDMILTSAIHGLIVLHIDLHIDLLIDTTLARDIDHALIQEKTTFQNIEILTDHLPDQENLDFLDHGHIPILHIDLLIDKTLARDIDHALIQEKTTFQNIQILTDHLPDQKILDFLDHSHIPILETNSI